MIIFFSVIGLFKVQQKPQKAGKLTFIDKKTSNQSAENLKNTMLDCQKWLAVRDTKLC